MKKYFEKYPLLLGMVSVVLIYLLMMVIEILVFPSLREVQAAYPIALPRYMLMIIVLTYPPFFAFPFTSIAGASVPTVVHIIIGYLIIFLILFGIDKLLNLAKSKALFILRLVILAFLALSLMLVQAYVVFSSFKQI